MGYLTSDQSSPEYQFPARYVLNRGVELPSGIAYIDWNISDFSLTSGWVTMMDVVAAP